MSNVRISQLPLYTGNTSGSWFIINNSGETQTFKIQLETILQSGTSGTSGTSGSNGSSGTSGINGTSGTSGTSGSNGSSGTSGSDGTSGTSGSNGSSGTSGNSGSSGTSGSSGISPSVVGFITTGSISTTQAITGSLITSGSLTTTGSISGNHIQASIVNNTASLNLDNGTFFTVVLPGSPSGASTHILPLNTKAGQTTNILIDASNANLPVVTFPSYVKQVSGSAYSPTGFGADVISLISFTSSSLWLGTIKNLI